MTATPPGAPAAPPVPLSDQIAMYRAGIDLIRLEGERLFQTFAAFLVAEAVVAAFSLNALSQGSDGLILIPAAVFGLVVCALWWSAYERHA
jgi:hypothetical protein